MTQKNDRAALLENFAKALGELTADALNELNDEKRALLAQALASGAGHVRLIVIPSPLIVIGALHAADRTIPAQVLFRIEDTPSGESH